MDDPPPTHKRSSSSPASIDVFFQPSPTCSSIGNEAVNVKKQKKEEDGELVVKGSSGDVSSELYISPSNSEHRKCVAYQRLQRFESKLERLDERSMQLREDCFNICGFEVAQSVCGSSHGGRRPQRSHLQHAERARSCEGSHHEATKDL